MQIKAQHSQNCVFGRGGMKPEAIVIHMTEGSLESALAWVGDIKSQVSYHYIIGPKGEAFEIVAPENTAWHAGLIKDSHWSLLKNGINPNKFTLGVAMSGFAKEGPTFEQYVACAQILALLSQRFGIPLDDQHIIGHHTIRADKMCPGSKARPDVLSHLASLPKISF